MVNVSDLRSGMSRVDVKVRVLKVSEPRTVFVRGVETRLVEAEVGDLTGTITLTLWEERVGLVKEDDVVVVTNGYITSFRGELRLNVGKYGKIAKIKDPEFPTIKQIREAKPRKEGTPRPQEKIKRQTRFKPLH